MKVGDKEINDECRYCGEIFNCELFQKGHGINHKRECVTDMIRCQMEHKDRRSK